MPLLSRVVLLMSATLCGGFFALSGAGFSRAAEPEQFSNSILVFWFVAGVALAIPLWLPAIVPQRYPRFLKVCRRVCAVLLLFPTWLFASSVYLCCFGRSFVAMLSDPPKCQVPDDYAVFL